LLEPNYIAGASIDKDALLNLAKLVLSNEESPKFQKDVWKFIQHWFDDKTLITVYTSGSTGKPSEKKIPKRWMQSSAKATGKALGLHAGQSALLCISAQHIGGMMMIVRSLELGMNLIIQDPSRMPDTYAQMDFTAMVPLQVKSLLEEGNDLSKFGTLIIGGAPIDSKTEAKLRSIQTPVFATFGMTETVSHVALRRLSGKLATNVFQTLPGIKVSKDKDERLVIEIAQMDNMSLLSNDLVEIIDDTHFVWKGRVDNIINSGALKINPESLESELAKALKIPFFIHKEEDETYGDVAVICLEGEEINEDVLEEAFQSVSDSRRRPKIAYLIPKFIWTSNGKLRRGQTFAQEKRRLL
jgi:O-succinylbenzoic acid--CoA ligase